MTFAEFAQKLMYLTSTTNANLNTTYIDEDRNDADFLMVETRGSKRMRSNDGNVGKPARQGLGCYRCQLGNHLALHCNGKIKDYDIRCHRCGSRKHSSAQCKAQINRPCRRCGGTQHFESICPKDLSTHTPPTNRPKPKVRFANNDVASVHEYDQLKAILEGDEHAGAMTIECDFGDAATIDCETSCNSIMTEIVDKSSPTLPVRFSQDSTPYAGLADTGASASFISVALIREMVKSKLIQSSDIFKLQPAIRIRFGNGSTFQSDMALRSNVFIQSNPINAVFVICPELNPRLIVGRPLLKSLGLLLPFPSLNSEENYKESTSLNNIGVSTKETDCLSITNEPWIEVDDGRTKRMKIRFPLFESILTEPIREPLRSYNPTTVLCV